MGPCSAGHGPEMSGMGTATPKQGQDSANDRKISSAGCLQLPWVVGGLRADGGGEEEHLCESRGLMV